MVKTDSKSRTPEQDLARKRPSQFYFARWIFSLDVSLAQKGVLHSLCFHADDNLEAWPGLDVIAAQNNISESTVDRAIRELKKLGLISEARRRNGERGNSIFTIHYEPAAEEPKRHGDASAAGAKASSTRAKASNRGSQSVIQGEPKRHPRSAYRRTSIDPDSEPVREPDSSEGVSDHPTDVLVLDPAPSPSKPAVIIETDLFPPHRFGEFWAAFPNLDRDRKPAERQYDQIVRSGIVTEQQLIEAAARYAVETVGRADHYIKTAANWLRDESWSNRPRSARAPHATAAIRGGMRGLGRLQ